MGSGSTRRRSDAPIIRRPKKEGVTGGSGSGGRSQGGDDKADVIARTCQPSFDAEIRQISQLKVGESVALTKKGEIYAVTFFGQEIGELTKRLSKMVETCAEMSVGYKGEVMERKQRSSENKLYARFFRAI